MTNARVPICLIAFTWLLQLCGGKADAQKIDTASPTSQQLVLSLTFKNNRQHLTAALGQQIEITLGTVGPPQYGEPEVSSPAIRLVSTALDWPPNPGGPTFTYIFEAAAEGEAQVTIPIIHSIDPEWSKQHTFVITIRVGPAPRNSLGLRASLTPDQSNTEPWMNAWTNLGNAAQTFVPSVPRITGVEVTSCGQSWASK